MPRSRPDPERRAPARAVLILAAYPHRRAAEAAARALVRGRLAACATVLPGARAFFRWEGSERAEASVLLLGKTLSSKARAVTAALRASHPDRVPEILIVPISGGHAPYLAWLAGEVRR